MRFGASKVVASSTQTKIVNITSNTNNFNLYNTLISTGWNGIKRIRVFVDIATGVTVGSTTTATPAFTVGNLRDIDFVQIVNNGNIFGAGGAGGVGRASDTGTAGSAGGTALSTASLIRVINNGIIGGGGGGSGSAGASRTITGYTYSWTGSCPGGTQYNPNNIVSGAKCGTCQRTFVKSGSSSSAAPCNANPIYAYPAGTAGLAGVAGSGSAGATGTSPWFAGGAGGVAGKYYEGAGKIITIVSGTIRGTLGL